MKTRFIKNQGIEYIHNNSSIIFQVISISHKDNKLTHSEQKEFTGLVAKLLSNFDNSIPIKKVEGEFDLIEESYDLDNIHFYKYVNKDIVEKYLVKGKFQLGSIKYYREIENKESRDEREGYCNLNFENHNQSLFTSVISGFDYFIFCGTHHVDPSKYMHNRFGDYLIEIKDIKSFANAMKIAIGAEDWSIHKVQYSDYKSKKVQIEFENFENNFPNLSEKLFDIIKFHSKFPSLFVKPVAFIPEKELRLVFKMKSNIKSKKLNVDNKGLLRYIEIKKLPTII